MTTIALVLALAWRFELITEALKLPALIGYFLVGIAVFATLDQDDADINAAYTGAAMTSRQLTVKHGQMPLECMPFECVQDAGCRLCTVFA